MKIEMIVERKLNPPRYLPFLGWVQDSFYAVNQCKKDGVIVEGSHIEGEVQTSSHIEAVYGSKRKYPTPVTSKLFLWVDGVLEEFRLISSDESCLGRDRMQLNFEVEKN